MGVGDTTVGASVGTSGAEVQGSQTSQPKREMLAP